MDTRFRYRKAGGRAWRFGIQRGDEALVLIGTVTRIRQGRRRIGWVARIDGTDVTTIAQTRDEAAMWAYVDSEVARALDPVPPPEGGE